VEAESWLLFFHLTFVAIWVGGNVALQVLGTLVSRERQPEKMRDMAGHFEFIGMRVFTPSSLLVLVTGVWLVLISDGEWAFSQFWVWSSLVMFAISFGLGLLYLGPSLGKAKAIWTEEGPSSERAAAIIARLFLIARIDLVLLLLIVFVMVMKPFL